MKDGGAAFPGAYMAHAKNDPYPKPVCDGGMTLRDWFAGQALASGQCPCNAYEHEERARWCKNEAEALIAMLKAREKRT